MKDQLIKLHDEFVDKGMKKSVWVHCVWKGMQGYKCTISNNNISYVLLDMQTWLREEHGIYVSATFCADRLSIETDYKYRWLIISLGSGSVINSELSKNYNEALLFGLQEEIKLI